MRFKTGDQVEVMNNMEVPVSWCIAEIFSASHNTYTVQYDYYPVMKKELEVVPKKFVRPCPPPFLGVEYFMTGAIVEVFCQQSWKIAVILNTLQGSEQSNKKKIVKVNAIQNQYLARLLGSSQELVVDRSNVRVRQSWRDGKWVPVGKSYRGEIAIKASKSNCCREFKFPVPQFNKRAHNRELKLRESPEISPRSRKRISPYDSSIIEAHTGHLRKLRATEKHGRKLRVSADPMLEKVDAVAYPKENLGEKYMHSNILTHGFYQIDREKQNDVLSYSGLRLSESTSDSDACSVGSCSVNIQSPNTSYRQLIPLSCQETDPLCSDAESSYSPGSSRKSSSMPANDELEGYSCSHASFASYGLKMMPGFAAFLWALNFERFSRLLPKRCYGLWPFPGITQFNLQYFSVFQDLLEMLTCLLQEGSIDKHDGSWFYEICVSINAKYMYSFCCFMDVIHVLLKLNTHNRPSCINDQIHCFSPWSCLNCEYFVATIPRIPLVYDSLRIHSVS